MRFEVYYYNSPDGKSPIESFLDRLSAKARAKCVAYMNQLEEFGFALPSSFIAKVRGDIWELRPEWGGTEYRFFYFLFTRNRFVILHAVTKKSQKLRSKDIALAEDRAREVRERAK
jgi:phage-related protein